MCVDRYTRSKIKRNTRRCRNLSESTPHLHPFPEALVVRQPFPEPMQKARFVGESYELFHEIALPQEYLENHLLGRELKK